MIKLPKKKIAVLVLIVFAYLLIGLTSYTMVQMGLISKIEPTIFEESFGDLDPELLEVIPITELENAQMYFESNFVKDNGHIYLYATADENQTYITDTNTNSEAISYYLYWNAISKDKIAFDKTVDYINDYMIHPQGEYLMWRLNQNYTAVDDGSNIASDAELRALKALFIAREQWGDDSYRELIAKFTRALERVAVTSDQYLAPYGGMSGTQPWTTDEVWLSYQDFTVFEKLANTQGEPWVSVYDNMKNATLNAQIAKGMYNTELTLDRQYGNSLDAGGYSINSLWIMVRAAESEDEQLRESARTALAFYKERFMIDSELYGTYDSTGNAVSPTDSPWVYALVARAALHLGEPDFAGALIQKMLSFQQTQGHLKGAIIESQNPYIIGQFTMQESIITLQEYVAYKRTQVE